MRPRSSNGPIWQESGVATVTNSPLRPLLEKEGLIVDEGPSETMFDKLDAGRVDFAATADVGGLVAIRQHFPGRQDEFAFSDLSYSEIQTGLFAADTSGGRAILDACRRGFEKLKKDGALNRILKDFFGSEDYKRVKIF